MPTYWKSQQIPAKKPKKAWRPKPRKATGERALFEYVWMTRKHECEICGRIIREPSPSCFAHIFPKGTHPSQRLNPENISLVCGLECHGKVDAERKNKRWPDIIKKDLHLIPNAL